jgi:abequosyltransferase
MPQLSICIPVYNFGKFIGQTLASISQQAKSSRDNTEVLVVDGASTDDTASLVRQWETRWSQLRYVRLPKRGGIDADLATSVRLARGEYCWLFSGDDLMREGAFARAWAWIREGHDVYTCKHSNCDIDMNLLSVHPVMRSDSVRVAEWSDPVERLAYMRDGVTSETVFSFMSGIIVRRVKWLSVPDPHDFMHSCWGHVARLLTVAQTQLRVCFVGETWVDRRGENDSFLEHGIVNRLRIAVDGYHSIADRFFGHASPEAAHIRRMIRNDLNLIVWLEAKCRTLETPAVENKLELDRLITKCYGDPAMSCRLARTAYHLTPVVAYRMLQRLKRQMKRQFIAPVAGR